MKSQKVVFGLMATFAFAVLTSSAAAQRPGKGKGDRAGGPQGARNVGAKDPSRIAEKMLADHDRNRDAQLQAKELAEAIEAQRSQRGGQRGEARDGQQGSRQRGAGQGSAGQRKRGGRQGNRQQGNQRRGGKRGAKPDAGQGNKTRPSNGAGDRAGESSGVAAKMISRFDENNSDGLDVSELTAAIKSKAENRGGARGDDRQGETRRRGEKRGDGEAKERRGREGQDRERRKKRDENSEPGTGVNPSRPSA